MELVLPSARRHGVEDDDIRHALHNAIAFHDQVDDVVIAVGTDQAGFVESDDEHRVIIHSMRPARRKFLPT